MAQVCQEQTGWMVLSQLLHAVCVQYIVLLQKLLCDLQDFVIEGKPGVLADNAQHLRITQAAAGASHSCRRARRQEAPGNTVCLVKALQGM